LADQAQLQALLDAATDPAAADHAAPAAVCLLWRAGAPLALLHAGQASPGTVFDLASLTKPLCTGLLALALKAEGRLTGALSLGEIWGQAVPADKQAITIDQLLCHAAGLPAWRPYFQLLERNPPSQRRPLLKAMLVNEPPEHAPGTKALYSDLGYLLLGLVLEEAAGQDLDQALIRVQAGLGLQGPRFRPLGATPATDLTGLTDLADLAGVAPCGPLPGRPLIHGEVEDENAHALGGVAGHAGLFGTAGQVAAVMDALCRAAGGELPWPAELARGMFLRDAATPGSARTPGFDTPEGPASAAGDNAPAGTVGHLGFTGVSAWWHPASNRGVVLLTNRVALGREHQGIRPLRQRLHHLAWDILGA
jgi:CubicO group peptidase (beta-lactamase class C family)